MRNMPSAIYVLFMRNTEVLKTSILWGDGADEDDADLEASCNIVVTRVTIDFGGGTELSESILGKLYELVDAFAAPLSAEEMEEISDMVEENYLDEEDDMSTSGTMMQKIIKGFVPNRCFRFHPFLECPRLNTMERSVSGRIYRCPLTCLKSRRAGSGPESGVGLCGPRVRIQV